MSDIKQKSIYDLELHECIKITTTITYDTYYVTKVPGGWLYQRNSTEDTTTFVPFTPDNVEPIEVD